jgi:hypothetical protein
MVLDGGAHPGGDARVSEVAVPLTRCARATLKPLLQTTLDDVGDGSRGKATRSGSTMSPNAGVWAVLGALLFYWGWPPVGPLEAANARFVLLWLAPGWRRACASVCRPSSYGHAILGAAGRLPLTGDADEGGPRGDGRGRRCRAVRADVGAGRLRAVLCETTLSPAQTLRWCAFSYRRITAHYVVI